MLTLLATALLATATERELCEEASAVHCYEICIEESLAKPDYVLPDGQIACDPDRYDHCVQFNYAACAKKYPVTPSEPNTP